MPTDSNGPNSITLGEVIRQFELWRKGCRGPGRVPAHLQNLAAQAAVAHGLQATADRLEIRPERLTKWMRQLGLPSGPAKAAELPFLELPPLALSPLAECHLEVEEPSGRKLRVRLQGQAVTHAAAVIEALGRASQP
jgi:hypothetical protein